ncbi:hypothetical protein ACLKA6_006042 [Drosophila palustris]
MELPCSLVITLSAPFVRGMEMLLHLSSDHIKSVLRIQIRDVMNGVTPVAVCTAFLIETSTSGNTDLLTRSAALL